MLEIIRSMKELDFGSLMAVYEAGNRENGEDFYPDLPANEQILRAEQDFYTYLTESFFQTPGAVYAIRQQEGPYVAALRLEPYQDGLLLEALETAPCERRRGHAKALILSVQAWLKQQGSVKVYSHVGRWNTASLNVHFACGFEKVLDHAVYADGSVLQNSYTLCWKS